MMMLLLFLFPHDTTEDIIMSRTINQDRNIILRFIGMFQPYGNLRLLFLGILNAFAFPEKSRTSYQSNQIAGSD
jgi:hypothetical protein